MTGQQRFFIALLLACALHAGLLFGVHGSTPADPETRSLRVTLASSAPSSPLVQSR